MAEYMTLETYGKDDPRSLEFLTKRGISYDEAVVLMRKHLGLQYKEARYRAVKKAMEEARCIAYERSSVLGKLMMRWQWLVRQYGSHPAETIKPSGRGL